MLRRPALVALLLPLLVIGSEAATVSLKADDETAHGAVVFVAAPHLLSSRADPAPSAAVADDNRLLLQAGREARRHLYLATGAYADLRTTASAGSGLSGRGDGLVLLVGHHSGLLAQFARGGGELQGNIHRVGPEFGPASRL